MNFKEHNNIVDELKQQFGEEVILFNAESEIQPYIEIDKNKLSEVCKFLKEAPELYFDFLNSISAVDNGPEEGRIELWYHLSSIVFEMTFVLKVSVVRNEGTKPIPSINSVTKIWKTADWHEREAFDLIGIHFDGHPDLRRILLPADWKGYPLRKDYIDQEKYHGVNIKYDR